MKSLSSTHILQKRSLRILSKSPHLEHHIPICSRFNLLDLQDLYHVKALTFLHDFYHGKLPPFFSNKLQFYFPRRSNDMLLKSNFRRTSLADTLLFNTLPEIWNPLPSNIKTAISKSKATFVLTIKNFYLSNYKSWECSTTNCRSCSN